MERLRNIFNLASIPLYALNEGLQALSYDITACRESTFPLLCRVFFSTSGGESVNVYDMLPAGGQLLYAQGSGFAGAVGLAYFISRCLPFARQLAPETLDQRFLQRLDGWRYEISAAAAFAALTYWELVKQPSGPGGSLDWNDMTATVLALGLFYGLNQLTKPPPGDARLKQDFYLG